ncbi:hypothetical protein F5Y04DRAFT_290418 [Hypomontagnella monticulosa]|nr:hypothetical protein F5Y04DRAFT_290418 [Hypomontagnella monticulosa]
MAENRHPFEKARDEFISSLAPEDRVYYSPCASAADLEHSIQNLQCFADRRLPKSAILNLVKSLNQNLEPYFKVVEIFVSSNPELAALVWGSLRLILQLAANFTGFFDQLISLLDELSRGFHQYDLVLELCSKNPPPPKSQIPQLLEAIYRDILNIFHIIVRIFTKHNMRLKRKTTLLVGLLWKPFDTRFKDVLRNLSSHRKSLFEEISIWHIDSSSKEQARQAAMESNYQSHHALSISEVAEAQKERELCKREREFMALERQESSSAREQSNTSLVQVQGTLRRMQSGIFELNRDHMKAWLSPPIFTDALDQARALKQEKTGEWIFKESKYQKWLNNNLDSTYGAHHFGSNVLWISGNPGAGKTVLASSIIDKLLDTQHSSKREVYYYFFEYKSTTNNSACSAYRSILAQVLAKNCEDENVLNRYSFMTCDSARGQTQLQACESILLDLLRLSLSSNSILVLDGIDECQDCEKFIHSLLGIWETRHPYIVLLSRVYVADLHYYIPQQNRLMMTESVLSSDIRIFSDYEIRRLFTEGYMPPNSEFQQYDMVQRIVTGAGGMFLWARLMINFLRSPYLYPNQRVHVLDQVTTPEGLEVMYDRIVGLIHQSGGYGKSLASMVLSRLVYSAVPMSSRQIHQSLVAEGLLQPDIPIHSNALKEFEDSIIMACTGLVERTILSQCPEFLKNESSLRLIHLSIYEGLTTRYARPSSLLGGSLTTIKIIPDLAISSLNQATNCLKQILFHTPAQPLSGTLPGRTHAAYVYEAFCFSDYAAACWLAHTESFVNSISQKNLAYEDLTIELTSSICGFSSSLELFLRTPRALSVWLEIFYTTEYREIDAGKYGHISANPLQVLVLWAKRVGTRRPVFSEHLMANIGSFIAELHEVLHTWGGTLRETPQVIWDEMTAFFRTRGFFWSSGSTRVSYQQPLGPSNVAALQPPTALLSSTSESGEMKAVLSIWSNTAFQDQTLKNKAWSLPGNEFFDLYELCTGWTATYELWRLQPESLLIGEMRIQLLPCELLPPMRNYLHHRYSTEADLPMSIHPNLTTFTILRTVFSAVQKPDKSGYRCIFCPLQSMVPELVNYSWTIPLDAHRRPDTYSTSFSRSMNHVALLEWCATGYQYITVYEYTQSSELELVKRNVMSFDPGVVKIERVVFHPTRPLLSFCAFWTFRMGQKNDAFIWSYCEGPAECFILPERGPYSPVDYSQCGQYFIVQERLFKTHFVIQIPSKWLNPSGNAVLYDVNPNAGEQRLTLATPQNSDATQLGFVSPNLASFNQVWNVDHNRSTSTFQVQASASGIQLSNSTPAGSQVATLVRLPTWSSVNETTQTLFLPQYDGDSLKISIDVDTQSLSTQSSYQLSKAGGGIQPSFIERDPRFVFSSNTTANLLHTSSSVLRLPYRGNEGKRGYDNMATENEGGPSTTKRRRYT